MNKVPLSILLGALALSAAASAEAGVAVNVDINPFGFGYAQPPVVYQPARYEAAPPVVYMGAGSWGDHRDARAKPRRDPRKDSRGRQDDRH